jgi:hypothetical protein
VSSDKFDIIGEIAKETKKVRNKEEKKKRSIETESNYFEYKKIPVNKAKQGDKYKVNFSLKEEIVQKIQYIQAMEGISMKDYSKIAELAIGLLYDIKYHTNEKVVDKNATDILKLIGIEVKKYRGVEL